MDALYQLSYRGTTYILAYNRLKWYNKVMASYSFDVVSEIDKAEMNNVFGAVKKELQSRFDFKGTPADIDWLGDKDGFSVIGSNEWQVESIVDIIRKRLASRNISSKVLDLSKVPVVSNLKCTKQIPFVAGIDKEKAKVLTNLIRSNLPKLKPQIQGESIRVIGSSKDELQACINLLKQSDIDYPLQFINYR